MANIWQYRAYALKALGPVLLAATVLLWASIGPATAAVSDRAIDALAGEIVRGLNTADLSTVPAGSGYRKPAIAIKAFADDGGPVDAAEANYVNDRLLIALQRQARGRFRFVARDAVGDLIADIDSTTEPSAERDARLRDLQANLRADILIRGTIRQTARGVALTYQAVASETGALFVSTTPLLLTTPVVARAPVSTPRLVDNHSDNAAARLPLDRHPTVLEAEQLLAELGYDPGPVDGVLTDQTRSALRAYQQDSALPVNGRMTWRVVENMRRDTR